MKRGTMQRTRSKRSSHDWKTVVPTQREVLRDVMLAAARYDAWMTLRELGRLTGYPEASISAQLRHLRRKKYGAYKLHKRVRGDEIVRSEQHFVVWEYRLCPRRHRAKERGGAVCHRRCGFTPRTQRCLRLLQRARISRR